MNILIAVIVGWLAAALLMVVLHQIQRRTGDAGIVDIAWSLGVAGIAVWYALFLPAHPYRRWLVLAVVVVWALRLSWHVWQRFHRLAPDGRYLQLKQQWGELAEWRMFRFYQMQALGMVLFSGPIMLGLLNPNPLGLLDGLAVLVGVLSIVGESQADWQLSRFRMDPQNRGQVCRAGWWRYSRHPNYFFEWLHWWAYVGFAWTWWPWGLVALAGPLAMWFFLTRVTGIPHTEAQSLKSRGDAYRRYQQTTNAFFPWFPKEVSL
jgi:steroid 5-alpha reductase family enzyme